MQISYPSFLVTSAKRQLVSYNVWETGKQNHCKSINKVLKREIKMHAFQNKQANKTGVGSKSPLKISPSFDHKMKTAVATKLLKEFFILSPLPPPPPQCILLQKLRITVLTTKMLYRKKNVVLILLAWKSIAQMWLKKSHFCG